MRGDSLKIGLLLPQQGPIGMWSLSCENCAQMAIAEINSAGGVLGRPVTYDLIDASGEPRAVAKATTDLINNRGVEAIIGMHTSDIRVAVADAIRSEVPFIFTPMYEGGESSRGVYMVGQTPEAQTAPTIRWMMSHLGVSKWYMIGNQYNYPYVSNQIARGIIEGSGGQVVQEVYVPFGQRRFDHELDQIRQLQPEAIFVNLVGDSCVAFNRAFGRSKMSEDIARFCAVMEENTLLGIGARNTVGIYSSAGYFQCLETGDVKNFSKLYDHNFGKKSPLLNQFAVSCYEGMTLLSALAEASGTLEVDQLAEVRDEISIYGPRGQLPVKRNHVQSPTHIVQANGISMEHLDSIAIAAQ